MIRCYLCPLQDLCPTLKEEKAKLLVWDGPELPEYCRKRCPLYVVTNEASRQAPEPTKGKR